MKSAGSGGNPAAGSILIRDTVEIERITKRCIADPASTLYGGV
jgi:hypothetical protein